MSLLSEGREYPGVIKCVRVEAEGGGGEIQAQEREGDGGEGIHGFGWRGKC